MPLAATPRSSGAHTLAVTCLHAPQNLIMRYQCISYQASGFTKAAEDPMEFQSYTHDAAYDAFMTLPPYRRTNKEIL